MTQLSVISTEANEHHAAAQEKAAQAVTHAIEAGRLLIVAKQTVKYGEWAEWLAANFIDSDRHARRYMKLHQSYTALPESKRTHVANLPSLRQALEAVTPEDEAPARDECISVLSWSADQRRWYFYTWPDNLWAYAVLLEQAGKSAEDIAEATAMDLRSVELALNPEPPKFNEELRNLYRDLRDRLLNFWRAEAYRRAASIAAREGYPELTSPCQVLADYFWRKQDRLPSFKDYMEVWGKEDLLFLDRLATDDARISIGLEPALEMIMWEIIEKVQLRANVEGSEFLLGI